MIRAYDDYGNVVDLVEWEKKIRADAIEEFVEKLKDIYWADDDVSYPLFDSIAEELKEQK